MTQPTFVADSVESANYELFGHVVQVSPPLDGVEPSSHPRATMRLQCSETLELGDQTPDSRPEWKVISRQHSLLTWPGVCTATASAGQEATLLCAPAMPELLRQNLILNALMGMLAYQRGALVLHAAAVGKNGRVLIVAGQSGAGKSTLAASFMKSGWELLSDDTIAVELAEGEFKVRRSSPWLKIDAQAMHSLDLDESSFGRVGLSSRSRSILAIKRRENDGLGDAICGMLFITGIGKVSCITAGFSENFRLLLENTTPTRFGFTPDPMLLSQLARMAEKVPGWLVTRGDSSEDFGRAFECVVGSLAETPMAHLR